MNSKLLILYFCYANFTQFERPASPQLSGITDCDILAISVAIGLICLSEMSSLRDFG